MHRISGIITDSFFFLCNFSHSHSLSLISLSGRRTCQLKSLYKWMDIKPQSSTWKWVIQLIFNRFLFICICSLQKSEMNQCLVKNHPLLSFYTYLKCKIFSNICYSVCWSDLCFLGELPLHEWRIVWRERKVFFIWFLLWFNEQHKSKLCDPEKGTYAQL